MAHVATTLITFLILALIGRILWALLGGHTEFNYGVIAGFAGCACYARWRYGFWPLD